MILRILFLALLTLPILNLIVFFVKDASMDINKGSQTLSLKNHTATNTSKQYLKVAK